MNAVPNARAITLLIWPAILGLLYSIALPYLINSVRLWYFMAVEAAAYALIIVWCFRPIPIARAMFVLVLAALANFSLIWQFFELSNLMDWIVVALDLSQRAEELATLAIVSGVGAFLFCIILDFVGCIRAISFATYVWCVSLCTLAVLPFIAVSGTAANSPALLAIHKTLWWLLFSIGLIVGSKGHVTEPSLNRSLPKEEFENDGKAA